MPKPKPRPNADVRVLDAAARLFRDRGFAATSTRQIARAAQILPGSLHYRYPAKEGLLVALMERAIARATAAVQAAVAGIDDPIERLRAGLKAHLNVLLAGDDDVYVLLYDWRVLRGKARDDLIRLRDRYEAFWDGMLYEAAGARRFRRQVDLKLLRLFGFGAVNWVATWYRPDMGRTPDQIADAFFACLAFGAIADDRRPADLEPLLDAIFATPSPGGRR